MEPTVEASGEGVFTVGATMIDKNIVAGIRGGGRRSRLNRGSRGDCTLGHLGHWNSTLDNCRDGANNNKKRRGPNEEIH